MNRNKNTYQSSSIQNKSFEWHMYLTKFTLSIFFFILSSCLFAQTDENYRKTADDALQNGDYYTAAYYYKILLDKDNDNLAVAYQYATANRLYNNYKEAETWFAFIVSKDKDEKYPLSCFYLAEMNKYNARYELAISNYTSYYNKNREKKDYYTLKALHEINSCKWAIEHSSDTNIVEITHLGKTINTPFSEFGAQQFGDSLLIYSSLREIASNEFESFLPEAYLSKIYSSFISVAGYSSGRELKGKINSDEINTANLSIDNKTKQAYFTRCSKNEGAEMICAIYQSEFKDGKWEKAKKLNNKINLDGYTSTQPSIVSSNDKEILYFASNRPGGFGQMDIWYSIKNNGEFQQAVNLGSNINTAGNEITPFYDTKSQQLYFASDWHFGYGGFDNFHSKGELNQWTSAENLGSPINTSYNDLYFTVNETENEGYLTSNRLGSYFIKGETCCNDIYAYKIFKKEKVVEIKKDTITIEESIKKLLPLTLYFHNDEPDPNCMNITTDKNYKQTLADYYAMKDKYKAEYSKGLKHEEYQKAINDIDTFFIKEVGAGFKSLELFTSLLLRDLQRGNEIRITVKGYASPLNTDEYNTNLSKRRISSLINFMKEYDNGILKPYMEDSNAKAKLIVYEEPLGKSMASKTVSDNPNDLRNSVYSKAAALERKIQILYYDYTNETDSTPVLKFINDSINFGKLSPTANNAFSIRFKNAGKFPFRINDVSTDCSCIKYYFDETVIASGKEGTVKILIVPDNRKGLKKQVVTLTLTPFNKKYSLTLSFE